MPSPSGPAPSGRTPACPDGARAADGAPRADEARPAGYRAVFAVHEFRYVFAAHLLSSLGVVVCELALSVLVFRITASPLLSALTFALGLLPYAVGGTLLSAVADRCPARRVLVACDLLCALAAAGMVLPGTPVAVLLALRCVLAAIAPVFAGTRAATLGETLGEGDLFVLGRSVIRLVNQGAQLAGFAAGGLLLAAVTSRAVLALTAGTFLASALLLRLGTRARPARRKVPGAGRGALLGASLGGVRRLLADRRVRALLLLTWLPPAFVVVPEALLVPYSGLLGVGPAGTGLLLCSMPIGAVVAESLVGAFLGPRARARLTFPMGVFAVLPSLGFAARPSLGWAVLLLVLTGTGISYNFGVDRWFVAAVPEELLGQAMTVMHAGRMTVMGLAMGLAGVAAQWAPLRVVMPAAGVVGAVCVLAVICEVRRTAPGPDRALAGPVRGRAGPVVRGGAGPAAGTEK
ncbi:putative MFS family arabinose efflux permease [Streptomyces sp. 2333.5]|uniref:MFS transporter n=1 Tax=unclassified Streptomyces TaxID=2593676 RepID=UPI00089BA176|nr:MULTISPECIES: MFS transporter [unclassified Streptomyces]PJJ04539.1 putative MFS family arabinose efflux permease [Streptomyces sp. 2333.5]SEE54156.1 Predicted arabinose efflux permease, MFS family [Streptomyces sp. 2314.4]SEE80954.1 Predicted arabinose efflux permease, MFS family [Streptomyces sp. 2112.2]